MGRLTRENLFEALELHAVYADLMRRTKYIAQKRGSNLLAHILASLAQAASGNAVPGALGEANTRVLFVAGHDTNLSNLSGMLDLSWSLPGYQPDDTPPGGALIFSLWQESASSSLTVKMEYVAASLDQMRTAERLTKKKPPLRQAVIFRDCPDRCSWDRFRESASSKIDTSAVENGAR